MSKIKLTSEEMGLISLLESITNAPCQDCIIDHKLNRLIFVVRPGAISAAIGKNGMNVKLLRKLTGKNIEIVEYSEDPTRLIVNSLAPAKVKEIRMMEKANGEKMVVAVVEPKDKGIAIGKNGRNIEKTRQLAKRYFGIEHVIIS
ncbi:MAG: NusA-like transcription termination signal-binding factor [Candidatus Bathyarchaeia archaeon]